MDDIDRKLMERALLCIHRHFEAYGKLPGYASDVGNNHTKYILHDLAERLANSTDK